MIESKIYFFVVFKKFISINFFQNYHSPEGKALLASGYRLESKKVG